MRHRDKDNETMTTRKGLLDNNNETRTTRQRQRDIDN